MSPPYPSFLLLEGRRVLLVGGGPVALEKGRALARAGAKLHVVAPAILPELALLADAASVRPFVESDADDAWFVVAAAPPEVNRAVRAAADARSRFVVAVDDVASCTAFGAATLERSGITIAISSGGRAPALVALLRRAIEALLPDDLDAWVDVAVASRAGWKAEKADLTSRRARLLRALNELPLAEEGSA